MRLSEFDYDLPPELIAQEPIKNRTESRLLVLDDKIEHKTFHDILEMLDKGDTIIMNNSKVIPARIFGKKESGGKVEILLLKKITQQKWKCLIKAKKMNLGSKIIIKDDLYCEIVKKDFELEIEFNKPITEYIKEYGKMPIPPYIKKRLDDQSRYQTVYAKTEGSAAAPTAGLHFTLDLIDKLKNKGVNVCYVMLHVGLGTFLPVKTDNILEHKMHEEYFEVDEETCNTINNSKRKIVAVGTTTIRSLESADYIDGKIQPTAKATDIFIFPGYEWKSPITHLITNFHLPKSTLLMLVSAFAGKDNIKRAYNAAIKEKYRFFSFGDAMLIKMKK